MPSIQYATYTDHPLFTPQKLGSPVIRKFQSAATALSASVNTVFDFTPTIGDELGAGTSTSNNVAFACGYDVVDATSGNWVEYGQFVSVNAPDLTTVGRWNFRLTIPPVAGSPSVIVNAYLSYFPIEDA